MRVSIRKQYIGGTGAGGKHTRPPWSGGTTVSLQHMRIAASPSYCRSTLFLCTDGGPGAVDSSRHTHPITRHTSQPAVQKAGRRRRENKERKAHRPKQLDLFTCGRPPFPSVNSDDPKPHIILFPSLDMNESKVPFGLDIRSSSQFAISLSENGNE
ncbi:hypothetical protein BaRGS_00001206 [Batillaria attramentaria]|uniref:Uncharacterized protein n=1 Tax=Batillaria attramentaria TaxID=370345 RepID=A0ABD0M7G1_9CAEN